METISRTSDKVAVSDQYISLIRRMRDDKVEINKNKMKHYDHIDVDDHGFIYFPDFTFTPEVCPDGKVHGSVMIGKNFKRFLEEMPRYINPSSALACCWPGRLAEFVPLDVAEEDRPHEADKVFQEYQITQCGFGAMNHCCPDLSIGLKLGWQGLLNKVRYYRAVNHPADTSFYDGEELLLEGILTWVGDHADLAEKLASEETDPFHKENYLEIARINRKLTKEPPETFREAVQFIAHFQSVDRIYYAGGALGSIEKLLREYYYRDLQAGILTDSEAVWIMASMLFNDTHYLMLGGLTPDGSHDMVDHFSFVVLEAMHLLHIPANIAIRVHPSLGKDDLSEKLIRRSLEYNLMDGTGVSYSMEKGISKGFARNGFPVELGRMRVKCGCNWCAIEGHEYPLQDICRINMPMAMQFAMDELKQDPDPSLDKLWRLFVKHLDIMVSAVKVGYDRHYEVMERNLPEIVLNLFMDDPIKRGVNCANGGVDIMDLNIDGIGLATVADSFAAIEQRVVNEKRMTWQRLFELLDTDFKDAERERLMLKNIRRYGSPDSRAEYWAGRVRDEYVYQCKKSTTPKHHLMIVPGLFSHGDVVTYGHQLKASANGRHAGDPISHSSEPDPGFANGVDSFSFVLKAEAVAKMQAGYGNSAPLQLDIDTGLLEKDGGIDALEALIYTHEQEGGTLINLNCVSKDTILAAHKNPEAFPDLVVRVTGYSAFFASLSKEYRQQVVDRFLSS